jgi:Sugar-binding cellulase-like
MTVAIPAHLPARLTISLWDFSWFTQTMPGEPFDDLDRAFAEAVERGYNTVRICAMPYTLFGGDIPPEPLRIANLGRGFGKGTRWYNNAGGAVIDGRAHLLELFRAAERHGCHLIVSSWEYQQTPSFFATPAQYEALVAIPPERRCAALADSMSALLDFVKDHGLADRIAYVELHNEVDNAGTSLTEVAADGESVVAAQRALIESAVDVLRKRHPDLLHTACYSEPALHRLDDLAGNLQVAHFHIYAYGVLRQLFDEAGLWSNAEFPTPLVTRLLRSGAPAYDDWLPDEAWRLAATGVQRRLVYAHDWVDPVKWDLYLYEHYHRYRESMREMIRTRLEAYADFGARLGAPAVIGEGYVGYTPLHTTFEEGPVGKDICEFAVLEAKRLGYWGTILCSNAAPHHPFWADVAWQREVNSWITDA